MKKNTLIALGGSVVLIVLVILLYFSLQKKQNESESAMPISREHCMHMPEMDGCEVYSDTDNQNISSMDHGDHASMTTSEESFVVNMIPHHQEAVDTARLVVEK